MATVTFIAQRILDENNYTVSDISLTNLEYLIDNAIDYINLQAGTAIVDLDGSTESKSLIGTANEITAVKLLSSLVLRAYKGKGPQIAIQGISVTQIISDPHFSLYKEMIDSAVNRLIGSGFKRV